MGTCMIVSSWATTSIEDVAQASGSELRWFQFKPEPIMLSVLLIIPSRISHNFIPMPSPIIPVVFFKFLLCQ